jgi:hypothetical protein
MEKLRTKKDECVPQSIEPIEFKVSFPKIHPSDPEKLGLEIFKDKNKIPSVTSFGNFFKR